MMGDLAGIQTQDLQNRNLTLYSTKLRDHAAKLLLLFGLTKYLCQFFIY